MAAILAIDTSTEVCSLAIRNKGEIFLLEEHRRYLHASYLAPMIKRILGISGVVKPDVIAVSSVPSP